MDLNAWLTSGDVLGEAPCKHRAYDSSINVFVYCLNMFLYAHIENHVKIVECYKVVYVSVNFVLFVSVQQIEISFFGGSEVPGPFQKLEGL